MPGALLPVFFPKPDRTVGPDSAYTREALPEVRYGKAEACDIGRGRGYDGVFFFKGIDQPAFEGIRQPLRTNAAEISSRFPISTRFNASPFLVPSLLVAQQGSFSNADLKPASS